MFGAIRPLGLLLASLPVGVDPGATAGANFQLAYRSNFLLPHRRVAWIRFAERLDEARTSPETIAAFGETRPVRLTGSASSSRGPQASLTTHIELV